MAKQHELQTPAHRFRAIEWGERPYSHRVSTPLIGSIEVGDYIRFIEVQTPALAGHCHFCHGVIALSLGSSARECDCDEPTIEALPTGPTGRTMIRRVTCRTLLPEISEVVFGLGPARGHLVEWTKEPGVPWIVVASGEEEALIAMEDGGLGRMESAKLEDLEILGSRKGPDATGLDALPTRIALRDLDPSEVDRLVADLKAELDKAAPATVLLAEGESPLPQLVEHATLASLCSVTEAVRVVADVVEEVNEHAEVYTEALKVLEEVAAGDPDVVMMSWAVPWAHILTLLGWVCERYDSPTTEERDESLREVRLWLQGQDLAKNWGMSRLLQREVEDPELAGEMRAIEVLRSIKRGEWKARAQEARERRAKILGPPQKDTHGWLRGAMEHFRGNCNTSALVGCARLTGGVILVPNRDAAKYIRETFPGVAVISPGAKLAGMDGPLLVDAFTLDDLLGQIRVVEATPRIILCADGTAFFGNHWDAQYCIREGEPPPHCRRFSREQVQAREHHLAHGAPLSGMVPLTDLRSFPVEWEGVPSEGLRLLGEYRVPLKRAHDPMFAAFTEATFGLELLVGALEEHETKGTPIVIEIREPLTEEVRRLMRKYVDARLVSILEEVAAQLGIERVDLENCVGGTWDVLICAPVDEAEPHSGGKFGSTVLQSNHPAAKLGHEVWEQCQRCPAWRPLTPEQRSDEWWEVVRGTVICRLGEGASLEDVCRQVAREVEIDANQAIAYLQQSPPETMKAGAVFGWTDHEGTIGDWEDCLIAYARSAIAVDLESKVAETLTHSRACDLFVGHGGRMEASAANCPECLSDEGSVASVRWSGPMGGES